MLRNITVYALLTVSMMTAWADEVFPIVEFIKDGKVIESREMNHEEYRSFMNLQALGSKLQRLESPLERMEQTIDKDVKAIAKEAARIDETLSDMKFESLADLSQLHVLGDIEFDKINNMMEHMQPLLDEITAMSEEIGSTTNNFRSTLMNSYSDDQVDEIKIKVDTGQVVLIKRDNTIFNL